MGLVQRISGIELHNERLAIVTFDNAVSIAYEHLEKTDYSPMRIIAQPVTQESRHEHHLGGCFWTNGKDIMTGQNVSVSDETETILDRVYEEPQAYHNKLETEILQEFFSLVAPLAISDTFKGRDWSGIGTGLALGAVSPLAAPTLMIYTALTRKQGDFFSRGQMTLLAGATPFIAGFNSLRELVSPTEMYARIENPEYLTQEKDGISPALILHGKPEKFQYADFIFPEGGRIVMNTQFYTQEPTLVTHISAGQFKHRENDVRAYKEAKMFARLETSTSQRLRGLLVESMKHCQERIDFPGTLTTQDHVAVLNSIGFESDVLKGTQTTLL